MVAVGDESLTKQSCDDHISVQSLQIRGLWRIHGRKTQGILDTKLVIFVVEQAS